MSPAQRRDAVSWARTAYLISERRACRALVVERTGVRYRSRTAPDAALRQGLRELAQARPAFGHKRLHVLQRRDRAARASLRRSGLPRARKPRSSRAGGRMTTTTGPMHLERRPSIDVLASTNLDLFG